MPSILSALVAAGVVAVAGESVPPSASAGEHRLFVLDLTATGVDPALTRNLSEVLLAAVREARGDVGVVGQAEINSMLAVERQRDLVGCSEDAACLAELGGALGAELLTTGSIGKVGRVYLINLKLIDTRRAQVVRHVTRELRVDEDALIPAMRQLGANLVDPSRPVILPTVAESALAAVEAPPPFERRWWLRAGFTGHRAFTTVSDSSRGMTTRQPPLAEPDANLQVGFEVVPTLFVLASGSFHRWDAVMEGPVPGGFDEMPSLGTTVYSFGAGVAVSSRGSTRFAGGLLIEAGHFAYDTSSSVVQGTSSDQRFFILVPSGTWKPVTTTFADLTTVIAGRIDVGLRASLTWAWTNGQYRDFTTGQLDENGSSQFAPFISFGLGLVAALH